MPREGPTPCTGRQPSTGHSEDKPGRLHLPVRPPRWGHLLQGREPQPPWPPAPGTGLGADGCVCGTCRAHVISGGGAGAGGRPGPQSSVPTLLGSGMGRAGRRVRGCSPRVQWVSVGGPGSHPSPWFHTPRGQQGRGPAPPSREGTDCPQGQAGGVGQPPFFLQDPYLSAGDGHPGHPSPARAGEPLGRAWGSYQAPDLAQACQWTLWPVSSQPARRGGPVTGQAEVRQRGHQGAKGTKGGAEAEGHSEGQRGLGCAAATMSGQAASSFQEGAPGTHLPR